MKKRLLFMGVAATLLLFASCTDEDKMLLSAPYRVQGELNPQFRLPVISRGELNLNDLLKSLDGDFSGNLDINDTTVVFKYENEFSDTIEVNATGKRSYAPAPRTKKRHARKDDTDNALFSIDTVISYPIDIDLFDKVDPNLLHDGNTIHKIWLDLTAAIKGFCPDNAAQAVHDYVSARFDSLAIGYLGNDGLYHTDFELPPLSLVIDDILVGDSITFKDVDLAPIFNKFPRHLDISFHLNLIVDNGFAEENTQDLEHIEHFQELLDSLGMTTLLYDAKINVRIPFEVHLDQLAYSYSLNLRGEGSAEGSSSIFDKIDSILNSMLGEGAVSIDSSSVTAYLVLQNGIPLNFTLNGVLVDENGNELQNGTLVEHQFVAASGTMPTGVADVLKADPDRPVESIVELPLTMGQLQAFSDASALKLDLGMTTNGSEYMRVGPEDCLRMSLQVKLSPDVVVDMELFRGFGDILGGLPVVGRFFNN